MDVTIASRLPHRQEIAQAAFALAQRKAQDLVFKQRHAVLRTDTWLDEALSFAGSEAVGQADRLAWIRVASSGARWQSGSGAAST